MGTTDTKFWKTCEQIHRFDRISIFEITNVGYKDRALGCCTSGENKFRANTPFAQFWNNIEFHHPFSPCLEIHTHFCNYIFVVEKQKIFVSRSNHITNYLNLIYVLVSKFAILYGWNPTPKTQLKSLNTYLKF